MKKEGFFNILMLFVMIPLTFFALFIVDYSKVTMAKQTVENVNQIALSNVLSYYDKQLNKVYGLFGVSLSSAIKQPTTNQTEKNNNTTTQQVDVISDALQKEIVLLMIKGLRGSFTDKKAKQLTEQLFTNYTNNPNNIVEQWEQLSNRSSEKSQTNINAIILPKLPLINPITNTALNEATVLKHQIISFMKFRGLMSMGQGFFSKLTGLKGKSKALTMEKKRVAFEKENSRYVDKLHRIAKAYKALDDLNKQPFLWAIQTGEAFDALFQSISENDTFDTFQQDNRNHLQQVYDQVDRVKNEWRNVSHYHTKVSQTLKDWEHARLNGQLEKEDDQLYQQTIREKERFLTTLNSTLEIERLTKLQQTIQQIKAQLDNSDRHGKNIDQLKQSLINRENWQQFQGYQAVMLTFYAKNAHKVDRQQKQTITNLLKEAQQNSKIAIDGTIQPIKESVANGNEMSVLHEKNVITQSLNSIQNSIQFFTQIDTMNDLFTKSINELLVMEYATEMFSNYLDREHATVTPFTKRKLLNGTPLQTIQSRYRGGEVEYILYGKPTIKANIEQAMQSIRLMRFGLNLMYSFVDSEIKTMIAASSAVAGPLSPLMQLFLHVLLSYAETEIDIQQLQSGKAVPIFKSTHTWLLKPSQSANGILALSKDYIVNRMHQGVDHLQANIYNWFENSSQDVEKQIIDVTNHLLEQQVNTIMHTIYNAVQKPLLDSAIAVSNGIHDKIIDTSEKITDYLSMQYDKVIQNVNDLSLNAIKTPLQQLLRTNKAQILQKMAVEVAKIKALPIEQKTTQVFEQLNHYLKTQLNQFAQVVKTSVSEHVATYKNELLSVVKDQTTAMSERVKGQIVDITDRYFGKTTDQFVTLKQHKHAVTTLSYSEYLKLFMFIGLISEGQHSPKYERMAYLIGENTQKNLANYYSAVQIQTTFQVERLFFDHWFQSQQHVQSVLGY